MKAQNGKGSGLLIAFNPHLPERLVNARIYERAQWHTEQAHKHTAKGLQACNKKQTDLHELAVHYHNDWAEYWNELYEEIENAILAARNAYEAETPKPKIPRRLKAKR